MKKIIRNGIIISLFSLLLVGCGDIPEKLEPDRDFDGLADVVDPRPDDNTYNIEMFNAEDISLKTSLKMDYRAFAGNENAYNKDIANLGLALTNDCDDNWKTNFINGDFPRDGVKDKEAFFKQIGCTDFAELRLKPEDYEVDKLDMGKLLLAHHKFNYDNQNYDVVFIDYAMTGPLDEWVSNFDMGLDDESYYSVHGNSHPDWKNKKHHKGFDVVANRTYSFIDNYLSTKVSQNNSTKKVLFFTGYSRGAAIANIAAHDYNVKNANNQYKIFGYTFSCPNSVETTDDTGDKNIFNIVNGDDVIAQVPLNEWGFKRYGVDIIYKISGNSTLKERFKQDTTQDYNSIDPVECNYKEMFMLFGNSREALYKENIVLTNPYTGDDPISLEDATKEMNDFKALLEEPGLSELVKCSTYCCDPDSDSYYFKAEGNFLALFQAIKYLVEKTKETGSLDIATLMSYPIIFQIWNGYFVQLIGLTKLGQDTTMMKFPHYTISLYYIINR